MRRRLTNSIFFGLMLALISAGAADASNPNDPDVVAYWPFDEGTGTVAADLSANGHDGTVNGGVTWIDGVYGRALQFNGSDVYVGTNQSLLNDLAGFTLSGWVSGSNIGSYAGLFGQNDLVEFGFTSENGGQVGVWMSGNGWQFLGADYAFSYPSWHHLALVGDASRVVIYIDGEEAASDEGGMVSGSSGFPFNIGAYVFNENVDPLLGEIDDVWVFSRALTQGEIQILMLGSSSGFPYASGPSPADGAIHSDMWVGLSWQPGDFAVSHDVYLGTNHDDVNDGVGDTFRGNKTDLSFFAGFFGVPFPEGLVPGTTYYWRIDEVNDADPNSPWKGDVWSFWVPSKKAYDPSPTDGTMFIDPSVTLTWTAGFRAGLHHVYFGDNSADVEAGTGGTYKGPVVSTSYVPGTLELDKTYYWRVNTAGGAFGQITGDVWSFRTTILGLGTIVSERWQDIASTDLDTLKQDSRYPNNPDVTEALTEFSTIPNLDQYGGRIHGWLYVPGTGDYTFWLCSDNEGELWLSTDDDPANVRLIAQETDWLPANTWRTGEEQSDPIPLQGGEKYYIMALWKEADGGDQCQVAWRGPGVPAITIIPGSNLSPYEPLNAHGAKPRNGSTGVTQTPVLEWGPGIQAVSHEVYFGSDENAVKNATRASPEYGGEKVLGDESYDPGKLAWESTYYWRIDEVNNLSPDSPWVGEVWSFTTADFGIVEDFESYNDVEPGGNLIYETWLDGYGTTTNGSAMGYTVAFQPTMETDTVHGGRQSVPLEYNNTTAAFSEAARTLAAQNWTDNGIQILSLWFYGDPTNTPGQLYVKINGVQVNYTGASGNLGWPLWHRWNIDLASVGANLQSVSSLAIGVQGFGATGTLLLDDFRLYQSVPEPPVAVYLEAEAADSITPPLKVYNDPLASGGMYIGTDDGIGDENSNPPADGIATYSFTAEAGIYKIMFRARPDAGNSFWVRIPGATDYDPGTHASGWIRFNDIEPGADWHWDDVHSSDHGDAVVKITLPTGQHTLEIARREDGGLLDAIVITNDVE